MRQKRTTNILLHGPIIQNSFLGDAKLFQKLPEIGLANIARERLRISLPEPKAFRLKIELNVLESLLLNLSKELTVPDKY